MTFVQIEFLVFFVLVFGLYWALPSRRLQNLLLAVSSALFYGWVHPWFLILLYSSAVLDYFMGLQMRARPEKAKLFLLVSMCGNLGMLAYFKYFDFFIENLITALGALGVESSLHTLGIFLPVGISFYTFQTMSYTIDIYRGELEPRRNFLDYVVFVSFFPQLVAGPVERAQNLLPQMEKDRVFSWERMESGAALAMWGAFKKVCIADVIAPYVDKIFTLTEPSGALIWLAALGFAIQILADFSGYTDIARGIARMMGFELMLNFKNPYLSWNPSQFWRRWHISFSTWIRDYIYIPVGGSRGGFWSMTRSTFTAMTISGLWHGASWNFVIWGVFHAALLTGYRLVTPRIPASIRKTPFGHAAAVAIMFFFTCMGWLIFREQRFDRLRMYATLNPLEGTPDQWVAAAAMLGVCLVTSAPLILGLAWKPLRKALEGRPALLPIRTTLWAVQALAIVSFQRTTVNDFIYFQF
ncbi:MAG: MBOAT family protein [Alphaproteobacteria bacterium]|nr:MBOAT family protein [Alphaproteobacteria bacterium]